MVLVFSFTNACTNSGEPMGTPTQIIPMHLHDILGGVVMDSEDVLEAVERLVRLHEALHFLPRLCPGSHLDIWISACMRLCTSSRASAHGRTLDLALGEADVQSGVLLEGARTAVDCR